MHIFTGLLYVCFLVLGYFFPKVSGFVYYPFAPKALYQEGMNVSFVSGRLAYFQEQSGYASAGIYNGVLGAVFDRTEKYVFLTASDGKKVRKLNFRTTYVGSDITCA